MCPSNTAAREIVLGFQRVLKQLGITYPKMRVDLSEISVQLRNLEEPDIGVSYCDIRILDELILVRPYMMPWAPDTSGRDQIWIQVGLFIRANGLLIDGGLGNGRRECFRPGMSSMLWELMKCFIPLFGESGVYLVSEGCLYPWDEILRDKNNIWQFHMAFIPYELESTFGRPPSYVTKKFLKDGIGFISKMIDHSTVWPDLPWELDGE